MGAMPQPEEPTVLDSLWLRPPPGNPARLPQRLADMRIMAAIEALPPPTRRPLVAWRLGDTVTHLVATAAWDSLGNLYDRLGVWDRHELVVRAARDLGADGTAVWLEATPTAPAALLARAYHHVGQAWTGRDLGTADEFAAATFTTNLEWARDLCERAAADDRTDPTPAVVAQRTWTGVDDILAAAQGWRARHPFHLAGALALVEGLARTGDEEATLRAAHRIADVAPGGHAVTSVVPTALAEVYRRRVEAGIGPVEGDDVFIDNSAWLVAAYRRWLEAPAAPAWTDGQVRNTFAFALFFANADGLAWQELTALGGHVTEYPWRLKADDAVVAHERARAWCVRHVEMAWTPSRGVGGAP